jgi:chemotaxis signal transduction protein
VSLYLRIAVGDGQYLLDAAQIAEIRPHTGGAVDGDAVPVIDLRELFAVTAGSNGCAILITPASGELVALVADRSDNLIEIADADWRGIPPIGPMGGLIDAAYLLPGTDKPLLRLRVRGENAVAAPTERS